MRHKISIYATIVFFTMLIGAMMVELSYLNNEKQLEGSMADDNPSKINNSAKSAQANVGIKNESKIFWFIHITDTQNIWYSSEREAWFGRFFNETAKTIEPMMIFNTGDLVDSDYEGFLRRHGGQLEYEWMTYARILNETGQNASNYYDMTGNHDVYSDPGYSFYQKYSIQKKSNYDFVLDLGFGKYHFIALNMAEDAGVKYPFSLFGHLNKTELDWYENTLESNKDSDLTFTFGHMPAYEVFEGRFRYFQLNRKYNVDFYLTGHGHENTYQMVDNRMPSWETGHLTDGYRIVAVDNNVISTSVQFKNQWPVGIITSPVDVRNINPEFNNTLLQNPNEIHVMAWDPTGIAKVEWRYQIDAKDDSSWSEWTSMVNKNGSLYTAPWSADIEDDKTHLIQSRITSNNGSVKIEEIEYRTESKTFFNWTYRGALIIVGFFGAVIGTPVGRYYLRKTNRISKKQTDQHVDPRFRNLLLLKILVLIFVPLTLSELIPESIMAIFGWGLIGKMGILFNDIAAMVGGFLMLISISFLSGFLSPRKCYWMIFIALPLSMILEIAMIVLTVVLIDFYALIAPGLYILITIDVLMYRRELEILKIRKI